MRQLIFSPQAEEDIDEIYDFTDENWGFGQAESYTSKILSVCRSLTHGNPRGRSINRLRRGYALIQSGSHFIIYQQSYDEVLIVRILHKRMNIRKHI